MLCVATEGWFPRFSDAACFWGAELRSPFPRYINTLGGRGRVAGWRRALVFPTDAGHATLRHAMLLVYIHTPARTYRQPARPPASSYTADWFTILFSLSLLVFVRYTYRVTLYLGHAAC